MHFILGATVRLSTALVSVCLQLILTRNVQSIKSPVTPPAHCQIPRECLVIHDRFPVVFLRPATNVLYRYTHLPHIPSYSSFHAWNESNLEQIRWKSSSDRSPSIYLLSFNINSIRTMYDLTSDWILNPLRKREQTCRRTINSILN